MSFLFHLKSLFAGKVLAGVAAGSLVVAGVAVAADDSVTFVPASEAETEVEDDEDEQGDEDVPDDQVQDDGDEDAGDDGDDALPVPGDDDDADVEVDPDDGDSDDGDEDAGDDGEPGIEDGDVGDDADGRSATARAVHDALTNGEAVPGDEDFGQKVSENARDRTDGKRGNGAAVSEAARGANEQRRAARGDDDGPDASSGPAQAERGPGSNGNRPEHAGRPGGPDR
ncbi:MAG: hypothetical protein JJT89_03000 [Nitriliruptoraceae bacterium]|nr:hypothetical protein [Nitriliruptoraceae bacterium]